MGYTVYYSEGAPFMKTQMVKWGNSLAVRIPKPVAEEAKLKEGDSLEIEAAAEGRVELRGATKIPTLSQLISQITPENRYAEISAGALGKLDERREAMQAFVGIRKDRSELPDSTEYVRRLRTNC